MMTMKISDHGHRADENQPMRFHWRSRWPRRAAAARSASIPAPARIWNSSTADLFHRVFALVRQRNGPAHRAELALAAGNFVRVNGQLVRRRDSCSSAMWVRWLHATAGQGSINCRMSFRTERHGPAIGGEVRLAVGQQIAAPFGFRVQQVQLGLLGPGSGPYRCAPPDRTIPEIDRTCDAPASSSPPGQSAAGTVRQRTEFNWCVHEFHIE